MTTTKKTPLGRFRPRSTSASETVDLLLKRGGRVVRASESRIEIRRQESIASVDAWGRVEWRAA